MSKPSHNLLNDYHLLSYDVLDSTNEEAKRLAHGGASAGAVIWAKRQTSGRGRLDREWISEEGNLYVSLLLAPGCETLICAQLSFVAAVAALETLAPIVPEEKITCKWPNDIMLGNEKLGGVLIETFKTTTESGKRLDWAVVGVGINVDNYPTGTKIPATCLKEAGVEIVSAKIVLSRFVHNFICQYDLWMKKGFTPIRKAWIENAFRIGKPVEVQLPTESFKGIFKGIDKEGRLELLMKNGKKKNIIAGDVFFGK